jgi:uncharacterized protein (TIGR00299 family) protein
MNMAAFLDLGVSEDHLRTELAKIGLQGWRIDRSRSSRRAVTGTQVDVVIEKMDAGHIKHRNLPEIQEIIGRSELSATVKKRSLATFALLAKAEAKVHGIEIEKVHFHEVGATDAIVDIVGGAICLESLCLDEVWCGPVELGSGTVRCAHGLFPVPAPATAEILASCHAKVTTGRVPFEATTPTGAALLACCVDRFVDHAELLIERTGYGLGHFDAEIPNALRLFLGTTTATGRISETDVDEERGLLVECSIDDMPAEALGAVMDELFDAGARDVTFSPLVMKKSRPGTFVSVLCTEQEATTMRRILFTHTSTIGVREHAVRKHTLRREEQMIDFEGSQVRVKHVFYRGKLLRSKPEFDDCRRIALERGQSVQEVAMRVQRTLADREK